MAFDDREKWLTTGFQKELEKIKQDYQKINRLRKPAVMMLFGLVVSNTVLNFVFHSMIPYVWFLMFAVIVLQLVILARSLQIRSRLEKLERRLRDVGK